MQLLQFSSFKKIKPILQTEAAECGLACLAMIGYFHGFRMDLNSLRQNFSISLKGTTLQGLINIAGQLELSSRAVRLEIDEFDQLSLPCILHWKMTHFVVLKKVSKKNITIIDPAVGERTVDIKQLDKSFTGIALELLPTKKFEQKNEEKRLKLSDLWDNIVGLKRNLLQVLLLSLLLQVFAISSPFYMQLVIDDVIVSHDQSLLSILALGFGLLMLINVVVTATRSMVIMILAAQLNIQIANNLFHHLIRLPLDWFQKRHIGDVISRFGSLDKVKQLLTTGIVEAVVDGIMVIGTLVMMFIYSPNLAWVVISTLIIYGFCRIALYRPLRQLNEENILSNAKEDSNFIETVRAAQTIKLFNKENQRQSVWQNLYADTMNTGIRLTKLNVGYRSINGILFGLENIFVIYLAASNVIEGVLSVGMLYAFMAYKGQFTSKATALIERFIEFKMLSLHLTRLGDIALTPIESETNLSINKPITGQLQLDNVDFNYSSGEPLILKKASVVIHAGESVAIVGPSGCGKSTLMKVMLGLLKPEMGQVTVDGIDISKLGHKLYRQQIAAVMQDDLLLSGTISDNICFFDPEYDLKIIEDCAKLATIHEDIMAMPMAYNSLIGDMGNTLSGGQKQRLILARALYKKPKILFLDEATSHLDTCLESHVNASIKHLKITRIIIAHRQETINSADRVFLLDNGNLREVTKVVN